jgi:hypothetical protein
MVCNMVPLSQDLGGWKGGYRLEVGGDLVPSTIGGFCGAGTGVGIESRSSYSINEGSVIMETGSTRDLRFCQNGSPGMIEGVTDPRIDFSGSCGSRMWRVGDLRGEGVSETTFDCPEWMVPMDILCRAELLCMRPAAFGEDCDNELQ